MKIKYAIEADENGYSVHLSCDGVDVHNSYHEKNEYGTKQKSGDKDEDCEDDDFYEILQDFLPFNLFRIAKDRTDEE